MKIALDYDKTFTRDKYFWNDFIASAKLHGHDIKFVTYRFENSSTRSNADIIADAFSAGIEIVFTNYCQKESVYKADIWVDDAPELIPTRAKIIDTANDLGSQLGGYKVR